MGYHRAGFDVVGVDINPQPHYPFEFHQADALEVLRILISGNTWRGYVLSDFAVIHASPPCQAFTQMSARYRGKGGPTDDHKNLLTPTLYILETIDTPWIVENVTGAKNYMRTDHYLHGGMFDLGVHRPRRFQVENAKFEPHAYTPRVLFPIGVYGSRPDGRTTYRYRNNGNYREGGGKSLIRAAKSVVEAQGVMGIDWMPIWHELTESIPPAYTEWIGKQLIEQL